VRSVVEEGGAVCGRGRGCGRGWGLGEAGVAEVGSVTALVTFICVPFSVAP
jgi:hypothetical protein